MAVIPLYTKDFSLDIKRFLFIFPGCTMVSFPSVDEEFHQTPSSKNMAAYQSQDSYHSNTNHMSHVDPFPSLLNLTQCSIG